MRLMLNPNDMISRNLKAQWQIDKPGEWKFYEWVAWLEHLLNGLDCAVNYKWGTTYIDFAREECYTWFILRWS